METFKSKIGLIAFVLFSGLFFYVSPVYAINIQNDFDSVSVGTQLNTLFGFSTTSANAYQTTNNVYISASSSMGLLSSGSSEYLYNDIGSTTKGVFNAFLYSTQNTGTGQIYITMTSNGSGHNFLFNFNGGGRPRLFTNDGNTLLYTFATSTASTWTNTLIEWRQGSTTLEVKVTVGTEITPWLVTLVPNNNTNTKWQTRFTSNCCSFSTPRLDNFLLITDADYEEYTDYRTRIVSFSPADMSTTSSPVSFNLHAYVNEDDLTTLAGIRVRLHNIDQNFLLFFGPLFGDDIYLLDHDIESAGDYYFSTSTPLDHGNYRIEACIDRTYLFGWIINNFSPVNDCQSHQFIVGSSTFLGNLSQNGFSEFDDFVNGLNATSSEALASSCNPLNGNFDIRTCALYMLVPSGDALNTIMTSLKEGILTRFPWGYPTRLVVILTGQNTASLPVFTAYIRTGETSSTTLSFDPADMLLGGASLVTSTVDPRSGQNARDIFEPMVLLMVALAVIFTISADVMGSHKHGGEGGSSKSKLS